MPSSLSHRLVPLGALALALAWQVPAHAQKAKKRDPAASIEGVPTADKATAKKLKDEDNVALIGHRKVGSGLDFYSQQKEIALGRGMEQQVLQDSKVITDPVVNEYINRLAQNLVRNSDAKVPFTVHVLQDDSINAFALPGGFFFVNSGLILNSKEEDE
ncbi:MAG TPA: M48 family metalloprotease, partial [Terriglobales bacterium]|nr:M48 family metalloprotease [Terriglobales bacterium]